jgi:hypothetical protein
VKPHYICGPWPFRVPRKIFTPDLHAWAAKIKALPYFGVSKEDAAHASLAEMLAGNDSFAGDHGCVQLYSKQRIVHVVRKPYCTLGFR